MRVLSLTKAKTADWESSPTFLSEASTPPPISTSRRTSRAAAAPPRRTSRSPPETMAINAYVIPSPPASSHAPDAPTSDFFGNAWITPRNFSRSSLSSIESIPSTIFSEIDCDDKREQSSTADYDHSNQSSVSSIVATEARLIRLISIRKPVVFNLNTTFVDQRHEGKPGVAITSSTKPWEPELSPPSSSTGESSKGSRSSLRKSLRLEHEYAFLGGFVRNWNSFSGKVKQRKERL